MLELPEIDEIACTVLLNRFDLKVLALTKGKKGSFILTKDEISSQKTPEVDVIDTIGAGDSFTAAMVMGLLNKKPLKQIHKEAIEYAAKICTIRGATAL
jgi:fructokinase